MSTSIPIRIEINFVSDEKARTVRAQAYQSGMWHLIFDDFLPSACDYLDFCTEDRQRFFTLVLSTAARLYPENAPTSNPEQIQSHVAKANNDAPPQTIEARLFHLEMKLAILEDRLEKQGLFLIGYNDWDG